MECKGLSEQPIQLQTGRAFRICTDILINHLPKSRANTTRLAVGCNKIGGGSKKAT